MFPVPQESSAAAEPAEADHGYVYEVLLQRIFAIMKQKNPEMASGEKKHIVLKPPQVRFLSSHARSQPAGSSAWYTKDSICQLHRILQNVCFSLSILAHSFLGFIDLRSTSRIS